MTLSSPLPHAIVPSSCYPSCHVPVFGQADIIHRYNGVIHTCPSDNPSARSSATSSPVRGARPSEGSGRRGVELDFGPARLGVINVQPAVAHELEHDAIHQVNQAGKARGVGL